MATVFVTTEASGQIASLPRPIRTRMLSLLNRLKHWPEVSGAKPLRGDLSGHYRLRTGDYRLQFRIEKGDVVIEQAGHRDGFYEE